MRYQERIGPRKEGVKSTGRGGWRKGLSRRGSMRDTSRSGMEPGAGTGIGTKLGFGRRAGTAALVVAAATGLLATTPPTPARAAVHTALGSGRSGPNVPRTGASRRLSPGLGRQIPDIGLDH